MDREGSTERYFVNSKKSMYAVMLERKKVIEINLEFGVAFLVPCNIIF
jgi:hypothetical protein